MKVLLSIKPQYVERIFNKEKKFEYRRNVFKRNDVDTVVIYATMPVGKVVGEFKVSKILQENPIDLWQKTKEYSGIEEKDYKEYFKDKDSAYAICIKNVKKYAIPMTLKDINPNIKHAPQSFMYIDN